MTYREHGKAARLPAEMADRNGLPESERAAYDSVAQRVTGFDTAMGGDPLTVFFGEPYAVPYYKALTYSPPVGEALNYFGRKITPVEGLEGRYSASDHEMIDLVLGFDSGYWAFHALHTASAINAGVRIECLEALRDGREDDLTDDEKQQVEFIRAVRDAKVTDDIWARMQVRVGSYRGVLEFAAHVCLLDTHHNMMSAVGAPGMPIENWNQMIEEYKDGTRRAMTPDEVAERRAKLTSTG